LIYRYRPEMESSVYIDWRKKILKRDGFACQMPRCKVRKRLQVHHIVPWSESANLRYETSNGVTLCYNCHKEVTKKEGSYVGLFSSIVYENEKNNS